MGPDHHLCFIPDTLEPSDAAAKAAAKAAPPDTVPPGAATGRAPGTAIEVEVDAAPFRVDRSMSAVDSGYSGQEEDPDDDNVDSSSCSGSYVSSTDYDDEPESRAASAAGGGRLQCAARDMVHHGIQLSPPVAFENISVDHSTNVQFGNNTHIHGPVTLVVSSKKTVNGVPVPSVLAGTDGDLISAAALAEAAAEDGAPPPPSYTPHAAVPGRTVTDKDRQVLLAGLADEPFWRRRAVLLLLLAAAGLVVAVIAFCAVTLLGQDGNRVEPAVLPNGLTLVDRKGWLAQPPQPGVNPLEEQPVDYVVIHHSASDPCYTYAECLKATRYIQLFHVESNHWSDIGYNFLVGGDGYVYEGRGWDKEGAHTLNWNKRSVGICMIGTFTYQRPTIEQMRVTLKLIQYGIDLKKIKPGYKLAGACQLRSTESPGSLVQAELQRWDHWWNYTVGDSYCKPK